MCIRLPVEWCKEPAEQTSAEQAADMGRIIDIGNNKPGAEIYADDRAHIFPSAACYL